MSPWPWLAHCLWQRAGWARPQHPGRRCILRRRRGWCAGQPVSQQKQDPRLAGMVPQEVEKGWRDPYGDQPLVPTVRSMAGDGKTMVGLDTSLATAMGDLLGVKVELVADLLRRDHPGAVLAQGRHGDVLHRGHQGAGADRRLRHLLLERHPAVGAQGQPEEPEGEHGLRRQRRCDSRGSLQQNTFLPSQVPTCKKAGLQPPTAKAYQDGPQAQLALGSNRIDAVMLDAPPLLDAAKKNPGTFQTVGPLVRNPNPGGVAFPKGSQLAAPINAAIKKLIEERDLPEDPDHVEPGRHQDRQVADQRRAVLTWSRQRGL